MKIKATGELKLNDSPDFHIPTEVGFRLSVAKPKPNMYNNLLITLHVIRVVFNIECHKAKTKPITCTYYLEWFSTECPKTSTKVIFLPNPTRHSTIQ